MKFLLVAFFGLVSFNQSLHASALVQKDKARGVLKVQARMVYSGAAATKEIASIATDEIQRMWNENPTEVTLKGKSYKVEFEIDYVMASDGPLEKEKSCVYNFVEIKNLENPGDRSYYAGLGSQNAVFYTSDDLGHSTTAPHEFGHGLMLEHNDGDQRAAEVPGIMFARGTLVKPEFQWDPNAQAGAPGGTINPVNRHVRSEDIQAIPFDRIRFNFRGVGCLGDGANKDIFKDAR